MGSAAGVTGGPISGLKRGTHQRAELRLAAGATSIRGFTSLGDVILRIIMALGDKSKVCDPGHAAWPGPLPVSAPKFLALPTVEQVVRQAVLTSPLFAARWRWNLNTSLTVLRMRRGKENPPAIQRMEADDMMAAVFPTLSACQENVAPGHWRSPTSRWCGRPSRTACTGGRGPRPRRSRTIPPT
jgi:hypothetical protein